MLSLISPAKSLDLTSPVPDRDYSTPQLLDESAQLIDVMRTKSLSEVAGLMHLSDDLAALNVQRYQDFETPFTLANARPALLMFAGDVYQGMAARTRFSTEDFTEAGQTLRIQEYVTAVDLDAIDGSVVSPRFEDQGPRGDWKVISFSAKRARGEMAAWLIRHRVRTAADLTAFDAAGYRYVPSRSTPEVPVFRRTR